VVRTAKHLDRWSRPIGRQVEYRKRAGQLLFPIIPVPFAGLARQHLGLPPHEVGVLPIQGRKSRRLAGLCRQIKNAEFVQDHRKGPEIDDDMVNDQQ
jgi:hypothetical protein